LKPASGLFPVLKLVALALAGFGLLAFPARAATPAGSTITNIASASMGVAGASVGTSSNPAALRVEELLDIGLTSPVSGVGLTVGPVVGVPIDLRNAGNGVEAFVLHGEVDGASVLFLGFALDSNGNGVFDASDIAIANDGATPALASGRTVTVFAILRTDALGSGTLAVTARALTGAGRPGTVIAGQGDGGSDAIVGATTAAARLALPFSTTAIGATPDATLVKSASVLAPDGSDAAVSGAIVTYTIAASFAGPEAARAAVISDPVPDGTDYVPASLSLDGAALSDGADADAGTVSGAAISFALGDVAGPATRTVRFQVKLK
jgi:uncharacterized repeat protein (TIGR01451 family)